MRADIAIKEGQLRDYEGRLGKPFAHEEYASQLADLRDRLKIGLSERAPAGRIGTPTAELAEQIRKLMESVTVEATPERTVRKAVRAERPVTARIREKMVQAEPENAGQAELGRSNENRQEVQVIEKSAGQPAETVALESKPEEPPASPPAVIAMPEPFKPVAGHAKAVAKRRQGNEAQLRLF